MNPPGHPLHFPGWHLLGAFPDQAPDDVGSWLLVHNHEAGLLEIPPGLTVDDVHRGLEETSSTLCFLTASHDHEDHLDEEAWDLLTQAYPDIPHYHPAVVQGDQLLHLAGEPVWLIKAPKHSKTDVVTIFRGVAMTGDIELGMLDSVNQEVPLRTRKRSMHYLKEFPDRTGYHVHSTVSAHLNSIRRGIDWPTLFHC